MTITIRLEDDTCKLLDKLKHEMGVSSYDEVIKLLARRSAGIPDSLFGAFKGSLPFSRKKEEEHAS